MTFSLRSVSLLRILSLAVFLTVSLTGVVEAKYKRDGESLEITLGLISPPDGKLGYGRVSAAATMAVEQAKSEGYLDGVDVRFEWKNGNCNGKAALGVVVELYHEYGVDGFIGLPCSVAAINAGKLLAHWDMPWLSYSSVDPELADKIMYNTLVRVMSPFNKMAQAIVGLFKTYNWDRVGVITTYHEDGYCQFLGKALDLYMPQTDKAFTLRYYDRSPTLEEIDDILLKVRQQVRIVVLCGTGSFIREFMLRANDQGMCKGDYVFLSPDLLPATTILDAAFDPKTDEGATLQQAYFPLLEMTLAFTNGERAEEVINQIPIRMSQPPWNYNGTLERGEIGSPFALFLYDTVYMYCLCIEDMVAQNISVRNGTALYQIATKKNFTGVSGYIRMDSQADRVGDYAVWHLPASSSRYELLKIVLMNTEGVEQVHTQASRYWGPTGFTPPKDTPPCGFDGSLCPVDNTQRDTIIAIACVIVGFFLAFVLLVYLVYRKKKFENDLSLMLWKIRFTEIEFSNKGKDQKSSVLSCASLATTAPDSVHNSATLASGYGPLKVGYYQGSLVAVTMLTKTGLTVTRQEQVELKTMRDMNCEQLNTFYGMCLDPPNTCFVTKYCAKGSLYDIIHNDDIKLDLNFKNSFVFDLINGMDYLHKSALVSHGRLKSSNCMVDGRWMLKVTDWGLPHYRNDPEEENEKYQAMYWTAPELLREPLPSPKGSQKGDVYSFAIILMEIFYRTAPYWDEHMIPRDIIGRVRNGESRPFRPQLPKESDVHASVQELINQCWTETPTNRPDFATIKKRFNEINKGRRMNIMDNMLKMMENYANNLEALVADRTKQLEEEKKKTDTLLYRMLPSSIADALKSGASIEPELYSNVSVYFSDIVSFTTMSSQSSPMEVVDFLNDLWIAFDSIIDKYDVYKVETIGDAYMVASGVPTAKPGCHHAAEIADMSLDILSAVLGFKIRHKPNDQLKVRIGIHSGPVVAGVVGLTMPRYCLFGDTVNTASRMESTGQALKIHLSTQAYNALLQSSSANYIIQRRGEIEVKGKGLQTTYWLYGKHGYKGNLPKFNSSDQLVL